MKSLSGLVGILVVLALVGLLAKTQLGSGTARTGARPAPAGVSMPATTPGATAQEQSQQIQQQVKQSMDAALQQARPMPDGE